jgi:hypothetical protein
LPEDICDGPCNGRYRKAQEEYQAALAGYRKAIADRKPDDPEPERPDEPGIRPWLGSPWCGRCQTRIRAELAELDDVAAIVIMFNDGHRVSTDAGTRVSGSRSAPSPSPASDAIDEMASMLRGWESALRGEDPAARRGYLAAEITTSVAWLLSHFDQIITHPDLAPGFGEEVSLWHRELKNRSKSGVGRHRKPMPCGRCHHISLYHEDGAQYVECVRKDECGRLYSISEYEADEAEWKKASGSLARAS